MSASQELFSARDLCSRWSISMATLWRRIAAFSDFPSAITFGTTRRYWPVSEIEAWEQKRVSEHRAGANK